MRTLSVFLFMLLVPFSGMAQTYHPSDQGSTVKFLIKNLGLNVSGSFTGLSGTILFNSANPALSSFRISIDAGSVNTGIQARDKHLRKESYFDVLTHPKINMVSRQIIPTRKPGEYQLTALLHMKGTSKEISFPFSVSAKNDGLMFTGEFRLNRRDFKIGGGSLVLSDSLTVLLTVFAGK